MITALDLMRTITALTEELIKYETALGLISSLWPEPPNCADIYSVSGINDGRSRAIVAGAAIEIARKALGKPFTE